MDPRRFDRLSAELGSRLAAATGRRSFLGGTALLGAATVGRAALPDEVTAKKKKKKCKNCCRENGQQCKKKGDSCKANFCLGLPFAIEAVWTNVNTDHDTYVFVPNQAVAGLPSPYIDYSCNPVDSNCEAALYPFICVSQDAQGPGNEITTVRKLIAGKYEYWIELDDPSPAGDLTVTLRRSNGSVVRSWSSPANPGNSQIGWHVFDLDGGSASMTSVDQTIAGDVPDGAHDPNTDVCPQDP